ncbi:hypothetical protein ABIE00_005119 [Arthrobacter sp. OAP107]
MHSEDQRAALPQTTKLARSSPYDGETVVKVQAMFGRVFTGQGGKEWH